LEFPEGFLWGAATASFQVEGAATADGKGPSIWDDFAATEGCILNEECPGDTCDHYRLMEEDVKRMADLGLKAYRFSICWPRVLPDGTLKGGVNRVGIGFYERLCKSLLNNGIEPVATLYHWDLPSQLELRGGWLSRDIVGHFADYANLCFRYLGKYVRRWVTINEPWTQCVLGYAFGIHAPGKRKFPGTEPYLAAHHMLLAHAEAVRVFRESGAGAEVVEGAPGEIALALNTEWYEPMDPSDAADKASQSHMFAFNLGWFADPVYLGDYPEEMRNICGERLPEFSGEERELLKGSCDFFGLNTYSARYVGQASFARQLAAFPGAVLGGRYITEQVHRLFRQPDPSFPPPAPDSPSYSADSGAGGIMTSVDPRDELSAMGWPVAPWGLGKLLCRVQERYQPKAGIHILENGIALDANVSEERRTAFLQSNTAAIHNAMEQGADVRGYFVWTLMDNFEWALGTSKKFGLWEVDFATKERRERPCCDFYRGLCQENAMDFADDEYRRILRRPYAA